MGRSNKSHCDTIKTALSISVLLTANHNSLSWLWTISILWTGAQLCTWAWRPTASLSQTESLLLKQLTMFYWIRVGRTFRDCLVQCRSKCGPKASSISIPWDHVKNVNSQAPPQTRWIRHLGGGWAPAIGVLTSLPGERTTHLIHLSSHPYLTGDLPTCAGSCPPACLSCWNAWFLSFFLKLKLCCEIWNCTICQVRKNHHLIGLTLSPTKVLVNIILWHRIHRIMHVLTDGQRNRGCKFQNIAPNEKLKFSPRVRGVWTLHLVPSH